MRSHHKILAPRWRHLAAICLAWAVVPLQAAEKNSSTYEAALESIQAADFNEYVGSLADDAMEGREAGTRGALAAANYLVEQYQKIQRLQAAGDDGGYLQNFSPNFRNVLALLPGSDPKRRDEVIVIGAHYDHLGYGMRSSRGPTGYIHPGADDNASGTSTVLELAKALAMLPTSPKRSILFAAWDAEEKGLFGSKHWAANPTVPIEHVKIYINLDMVGRLRDERLTILGSRSGYGLRRLLCSQNQQANLLFHFVWGVKPNADHYSFFERDIPILMFHTGLHDDYHRPADVASLIDAEGMQRLTRLLFQFVYEAAERTSELPSFREDAGHETPDAEEALLAQSYKPADRLGVVWSEDAATTGGIVVSDILSDSPAERGGLHIGDRILRLADRSIRTDDDFFGAIAAAESPATIVVKRISDGETPATIVVKPSDEEQTKELKIELTGAPLRWGFVWRVDDAEPGVIILAHVIPGSPAAQAGLRPNDRIYQVAGRDFPDEDAFAAMVKKKSPSLPLLIEREGRLRILTLQIPQTTVNKRAA